MMQKLILTVLFLSAAGVASAKIDYQCYSDCTEKGYVYLYCQHRCSYEDIDPYAYANSGPSYAEAARTQIDYKCYQDCENKGYEDGYCKQDCSY